jgi:hypothetical protein
MLEDFFVATQASRQAIFKHNRDVVVAITSLNLDLASTGGSTLITENVVRVRRHSLQVDTTHYCSPNAQHRAKSFFRGTETVMEGQIRVLFHVLR